MFKKFMLIALLLTSTIGINNGYNQTTRITFNGIKETCYGTLLSRTSVSGTWSSELSLDLSAPEEVKTFFKGFKDEDGFFYLNYFQDLTDGLLYWPFYPPEEFKVLLYFPDSDTFLVSDASYHRYALSSTFEANIHDDMIDLKTNYDYAKLIMITLCRILISLVISFIVTFVFYKPIRKDHPIILTSNLVFQMILHTLISVYSYRYGFSIVEYFLFIWIFYLLFAFLQGYLYKKKALSIASPYFCALLSGVITYAAGLLLVDIVPSLFTIV